MQLIFQACEPRMEVLAGKIKSDIFAAKLSDVIEGRAPSVYQDPGEFFEKTYPTGGLKALIEAVFGRLSGAAPANNPIIRLETSFGGGKTHGLIALYHIARRGKNIKGIGRFADPGYLPDSQVDVAAVVGTDLNPGSGIDHGDAITYTLWGEIAYQLAGASGYYLAKINDRQCIAPGTQLLEKLIGDRPTLIMIDEIARHLRAAKAKAVGSDTLAGQTVAFLHSLFEFAASKEKVVVVYTLAESGDAYAVETDELKTALREAARVSARQEQVLHPTSETEIAHIVNRRLFESIDNNAAQETAEKYMEFYLKAKDQGVVLPNKAFKAEYKNEMVKAYPFHPELLDILNKKTSTIHNFQKTRGALRLLAYVIRWLWDNKGDYADAYMIQPYHVQMAVKEIRGDLTSRLTRDEFIPVVEADIYSEKGDAHAQEIDDDWLAKGQPPLGTRVAQTVFLHSITQGGASGADAAEINLSVGQPGLEFGFIEKARDQLVDKCWYMSFDGSKYRFKAEPSINKIIHDEMDNVGFTEAKQELNRRIRAIYAERYFKPVFFPEGPDEVDDSPDRPKLVIIHYDSEKVEATDSEPTALVRRIYERAGGQNAWRVYQNNLFFLVAGAPDIPDMIEKARYFVALKRITDDKDRMKTFEKQQQQELKNKLDSGQLDVRVAITRAYRHLFYPTGEASELKHHVLPIQNATEVEKEKEQQAVILRTLKDLNKALTADDKGLAADYVRSKVWQSARDDQMTTEEFRRIFCQKRSLPIVMDQEQIKKTIKDGVEKGLWVCYDGKELYDAKKVSALNLQISESFKLYTPEKAKELGLIKDRKEKGKNIDINIKLGGSGKPDKPEQKICGKCGKYPCICDFNFGPIELEAAGTPNKAFAGIIDLCRDNKIEKLEAITIEVEGADAARALGRALPQVKKANLTIEQEFRAQMGEDTLEMIFNGSWKNFREIKNLTERFGKVDPKAEVITRVELTYNQPVQVMGEEIKQLQELLNNFAIEHVKLSAREAGEES